MEKVENVNLKGRATYQSGRNNDLAKSKFCKLQSEREKITLN